MDTAPIFWPMSIVVNRLDGSRCHLARRRPRSWPHWDAAPNLILFFYSPTYSLTIHLFIALMHCDVKIPLTHPAVRNLHELVLSRFHTFVLQYHPVIMFGEIVCSEDRGSNNW